MKRSQKIRLDYKILSNTGERVAKDIEDLEHRVKNWTLEDGMPNDEEVFIKERTSEEISTNSRVEINEEQLLYEDILDFFGENDLSTRYFSVDGLTAAIKEVKELKDQFKRVHQKLLPLTNYAERYAERYAYILSTIKQFIMDANYKKDKYVMEEDEVKRSNADAQKNAFKFQLSEVQRNMDEMEELLLTDLSADSDKEINRKRIEMGNHGKRLAKVGEKIENIIKFTGNSKVNHAVIALQERYENLICLKQKYCKTVKSEAETRELDKLELFETSSLNIKLPKFKGYGSVHDIFTFRSLFEKLHLKSTPKKLLPDLLKNNFLENPALLLVKNVNEIDEIWARLQDAYGNTKIMLNKKLSEFSSIEGLWKLKDSNKIAEGIVKVINLMRDLMSLSEEHKIENQLYYGDAIDKIYKLLGDKRLLRWLSVQCESNWEGKELWDELIKFLEKERKVNQQKALMNMSNTDRKNIGTSKDFSNRNYFSNDNLTTDSIRTPMCFFCGETDHVCTNGPGGSKVCQYFSCKKFVELSPASRFAELRKKGLCFQCLFPGAKREERKHKSGLCQRDYTCKHPSHDKYKTKMHVLVCEEHKDRPENKDLLDKYKERFVLTHPTLPNYSQNIALSFHSLKVSKKINETLIACDNLESPIYMLQTIEVDGHNYTLFYDSGCSDFVCRHEAIEKLGSRAKKEYEGPVKLGGIGGIGTESPHGIYSVKLPLASGSDAILTGVCLEQLTSEFPQYPLSGNVEEDIKEAYFRTKGNLRNLPKLPTSVGGHVDFMLGIKYFRHFPEFVFQLPSGLTIYKSRFRNSDGSRGVIGGPHQVFTEIEKVNNASNQPQINFISNQLFMYKNGYLTNPDVSLLGYRDTRDIHKVQSNLCTGKKCKNECMVSRQIRLFERAEEAGSQVTYRCVNCRDCKICKSTIDEEIMSIKEEIEQAQIDKSVIVDIKNSSTIARLPIMHNPSVKLHPNRHKALKVFQQQMKKLDKSVKDKTDVVTSERKLQNAGYVEYVRNLPKETQTRLEINEIKNFIPWRAVWKENSLSTPCRLVFDASQPTDSGFSLNDILPKGRNSMNKLVEIFIRWRVQKVAFHTDISKMYNSINLHEDDWCYQRYLWRENLDEVNPIEEKVIKTLIYGVRSSGNQAETGLRKTAVLSEKDYPEVCETIKRDIYVDDCLSGEQSYNLAVQRADELELVLNGGGYALKGITLSGDVPNKELSSDGKSLNVAGLIWEPERDTIRLDIKDINFAKKVRGRKLSSISEVPSKLTRRHCVSKIAEVFDITGIFTPIIASMKVDLHELVVRKLDWDDVIPDSFRNMWINHFEMLQEIKHLQFKRAVIPDDAVSTDVNTLCFGDASRDLLCIAIYARFQRKTGTFSCQLIFARSRLIPECMTQPRGELYAALVNTHSSEVVRRALYRYHHSSIKFTDSQIVLYWLNNDSKVLKQWVKNRIIEIHRFTSINDWRFVLSENMIADLGTRKNSSLETVSSRSEWINGYDWMGLDESHFPAYTVNDIIMSKNHLEEVRKECSFDISESTYFQMTVPNQVADRYKFSNYLVDPNKYRFRTVVRIVAIVIKFVAALKRELKRCVPKRNAKASKSVNEHGSLILTDEEIKSGELYYFRKATEEIKRFLKPKQFEKFSVERDGILIYTGRILEDSEFTIVGRITASMKDLTASRFCVPLVERHSPIAFSIVNEIHWYSQVHHSGVETTLREIMKTAYIIEGRELVKNFNEGCHRCRYLKKKKVNVAMGPVSPVNLAIAPCFYNCQIDIAGPYSAYTHHHKRKTIKIWLVVFCCCTTSATHINVMEDYSANSFMQSFIRFSCSFGYPKLLLSDEGSQIVKSFKSMELNFIDIQQQLHKDVMVEYNICPVGGHNVNGRVERKIREVKLSIQKVIYNSRYSILQWETLCAEISNTINNLPLALGNIISDFDTMDLITPNRLILGRNNYRSPTECVIVSNNPEKILRENQAIFESWFENWLLNHVPKLMLTPKWFKSDENIKEGDVVLFLKHDSQLSSHYQYGIVESVKVSRDGRIREVEVKYKNYDEGTFRFTRRAVRELIVIHHVDELDMYSQLKDLAINVSYDT